MRAQKRFRVSLSFPGEHRAFVEQVAALLADKLGRDCVLYDRYHEAELARPDLDTYLPNLYSGDSELIAIFLCAEYANKRWCKLEWRSIRQLISTSDSGRIMFLSFDDIGPVPEIGIVSGDGYISIGNRTPQMVAGLIEQRLRVNAAQHTQSAGPATNRKTSPDSDLIVDSSGSWLLLNDRFHIAQSVRHNSDGSVIVKIASADADNDAAIRKLRPSGPRQGLPVAFGYRNDASYAIVQNVEAESRGDESVWILTLRLAEFGGGIMTEIGYGGDKPLSADDIARMRASRILLNDPPEMADDNQPAGVQSGMVEILLQGVDTPLKTRHCVLGSLYPQMKGDTKLFLRCARLLAIFTLRAGGAVEHILKLSLGPIRNGNVHVCFRGVRRKKYSNVEPVIIALEGDCPLT